jgi:predicted ester cyclase
MSPAAASSRMMPRIRAAVRSCTLPGRGPETHRISPSGAELIDDFVHPDFSNHTVEPGQRDDRTGVLETTRAMHEAFSELRVEILHCVSDGDLVATHKVFRGRHTGSWFGVPPSGNAVEFRVMDLGSLPRRPAVRALGRRRRTNPAAPDGRPHLTHNPHRSRCVSPYAGPLTSLAVTLSGSATSTTPVTPSPIVSSQNPDAGPPFVGTPAQPSPLPGNAQYFPRVSDMHGDGPDGTLYQGVLGGVATLQDAG